MAQGDCPHVPFGDEDSIVEEVSELSPKRPDKSVRICMMTPGPPRVITQQKKILNSLESKLSDDFRIFFCW